MAFAENLDVFLSDFGKDAAYSGGSLRVMMDIDDFQQFNSASQEGEVRLIALSVAPLPVNAGETLTIDGTQYIIIRDPVRNYDGVEWHIPVREAA